MENNLLALNPEVSKQWHPVLNGILTPTLVLPRSKRKVWWVCNKGHEWEAVIGNRYNGAGCPACTSKISTSSHNFATVNPGLIAEWHYEKNNPLLPEQCLPMSSKKVWWKCKTGHEWEATISKRSLGRGCPHCRNLNRRKKPKMFELVVTSKNE